MLIDPVRHGRPRSATLSRAGRIVVRRHRAGSVRGSADRGSVGRALTVVVAVVGLTTLVAATAGALLFGTSVEVLSSDLPDPKGLATLTFDQPTVVLDRTGTVELTRFQRVDRRVVSFSEVPRLVLDAATTAEDRTFWTNEGFDGPAILSAIAEDLTGASQRGASTITQQLVRARLLPASVTGPDADRYIRKAKEIIQAIRVTESFPGEAGKAQIITDYLNEIFYGHGAYGIAAAAKIYFGVDDLAKLTPAQAALLAGLPKSPSNLDPYQYAKADAKGRLVVPPDSPPAVRRDWVLEGLAEGSRWTHLTPAQLQAALAEPIILAGDQPLPNRAGHFTMQVRRQLDAILGDPNAADTGGYTVITTLDWRAQQLAQKWMTAAAIVPNLPKKQANALLASLKIGNADRSWINALRGKDLHNGALVALDYQTGDVLAYVGSAGFGRDDLASRKFAPKFDAAGDGLRQPGSAFKPILYSSAFDNRRLTPGSLLLDVTARFESRQAWTPRDADQLERGPVLVRQALQYSLNVPAIRALQRVGNKAVAATADALGLRFLGGDQAFLQAGLAGAIGTVEVRPLDLASAFGGIANGGVHVPPRMILKVIGPDGRTVWQAPDPAGTQAVSPQAAFLTTDILAGNTDPSQNPIWAAKLRLTNGPHGAYRPAAVKTGTSNEATDLSTYGYLAPPSASGEHALAVGIWMGNSDHSTPRTSRPATSLTAPAPLWRAFVRDYTRDWPVATFKPPKGVVRATIDAWSGGRPGPWTLARTQAWFIAGTQPGARDAIDPDGLLYTSACGGYRVDLVKAELGPSSWGAADRGWMQRASRGPGVAGPYGTRTAYFWGRSSWGGALDTGSCPTPAPRPAASPGATPTTAPTKPPKIKIIHPPPTKKPVPTPTPHGSH
jgi:membrane peptidoglycan carboxypeptidase